MPLGYDSLASRAGLPSPQNNLSPGKHLAPEPTTASRLFLGSSTASKRTTRSTWQKAINSISYSGPKRFVILCRSVCVWLSSLILETHSLKFKWSIIE